MLISEVYVAPQGEGQFAGTPSVFVRTTGCNLRCWYCDTPFTSWDPEGTKQPVDELVAQIRGHQIEHVVVTGGEPMLARELSELTEQLAAHGHYITIETAGTLLRPCVAHLMSISPKLSNSTPSPSRSTFWAEQHESQRHRPEVITALVRDFPYQFKFVVDAPADIAEIEAYLKSFPQIDRAQVWLMPQAISAEALREKSMWLEPIAQAAGLRFSSRLHIAQYGNVRGK